MLRSALAVPMDGSLTIGASLLSEGFFSNDEIACGEVTFEPDILQSSKQFIVRHDGKIEVRVSWV